MLVVSQCKALAQIRCSNLLPSHGTGVSKEASPSRLALLGLALLLADALEDLIWLSAAGSNCSSKAMGHRGVMCDTQLLGGCRRHKSTSTTAFQQSAAAHGPEPLRLGLTPVFSQLMTKGQRVCRQSAPSCQTRTAGEDRALSRRFKEVFSGHNRRTVPVPGHYEPSQPASGALEASERI